MSWQPPETSFWCYSCTRSVRVWRDNAGDHNHGIDASCPYCEGGVIEEIGGSAIPPMENHIRGSRSQLSRRRSGDSSSFYPLIVLRGRTEGQEENSNNGVFEFYYDDGSGSGLRPLSRSMSEFLIGSGLNTLLEQLTQIDSTGFAPSDYPPVSKSAIESMPAIEIRDHHVSAETHCAVCKEEFQLGAVAREMPCKHIYHGDCIIPWLSIRNSCPVCRFKLPPDPNLAENGGGNEETVGLTIWRLPGGGFAVGTFNAGRRENDMVLPVVFTEMEGGFGAGGVPRRVSWVPVRRSGRREGGGSSGERGGRLRRFVRGLLRRFRSTENDSSSFSSRTPSGLRSNGESRTMFRSFSSSSSGFGSFFGRVTSRR